MLLGELFDVKNGIASSDLIISENKTPLFSIPFIRPSNSWKNLVVGYIERNEIDTKFIFPKDSLIVSTNGQGSHSYAYVCPVEFVPNSDVSVLIPKRVMDKKEKIFYAMCITKNRFKFNYGRKPKGNKLDNIILPELPFNWIEAVQIPTYSVDLPYSTNKSIEFNLLDLVGDLFERKWSWFRYDSLFEIERGRGARVTEVKDEGQVKFITSTDRNNGLKGFVNNPPAHKGNVISVNRNGSVGEAFYQPEPFCSTEDVHVFIPKFDLNEFIAMFLITLIKKEKYRYSYGRKWGLARMRESLIKLPITEMGKPDWKFMEDYIKNLPYSLKLT